MFFFSYELTGIKGFVWTRADIWVVQCETRDVPNCTKLRDNARATRVQNHQARVADFHIHDNI
jgi:hypothetical protein